MDDFVGFFERATGRQPYVYQSVVARNMPSIVNMPTGSGKTEAVITGWLWRRTRYRTSEPRRLIYCLPRRTLVEQTAERARDMVRRLGIDCPVHIMMGGEMNTAYEDAPDRQCIIVGTQDTLLSGALNRLYGAYPSMWPMSFGILNNDCMWVIDEVQIMENGLPTSAQLEGLRESLGTFGPHRTIWMSATMSGRWLETPDHGGIDPPEMPMDGLEGVAGAGKTIRKAPVTTDEVSDIVSWILGLHRKGATAVIVNTIHKAQELYLELCKSGVGKIVLAHSKFRPADRNRINNMIAGMSEDDDVILVCTQVLEAGVNVSVRTLVTELAPWSSVVQRAGRCNRYGTAVDAEMWWMDTPDYAPYNAVDMDAARVILESMDGHTVTPTSMATIPPEPPKHDSMLRRVDLFDLFDTAADLGGAHSDASTFVRMSDDTLDCGVLWRESDLESAAAPEEICPVKLSDASEIPDTRIWDWVEGGWSLGCPTPGSLVLVLSRVGRYTPEMGWFPESITAVPEVSVTGGSGDSQYSDPWPKGKPVTLDTHTRNVVAHAQRLAAALPLGEHSKSLVEAALWHDSGKAHQTFQDLMLRCGCTPGKMWGKSPQSGGQYDRRGFRHEAASALCYMKHAQKPKDLVAYLVAAHHGKVRMSLHNHMGGRLEPDGSVSGLLDGDTLPTMTLCGMSISHTTLRLSAAGLGSCTGRSWTDMCLGVLHDVGPFKLAYLESVLRAADHTASAEERSK